MSNLITRYGGGVRKRGKNYYYYFDGKQLNGKRNKIEKSAKTSEKEKALIMLEKAIELYYDSDLDDLDLDIPILTFSEAKEKFINEYCLSKIKPNTAINYISTLTKTVGINDLDKYLLKDIRPKHLQIFINNLADLGYRKTTLRTKIRGLSSMFTYFIDLGYINDNPCHRVKIPTYAREQEKNIALTSKEVDIILRRFYDTEWFLPLMLGLYTGMRRCECCGLRWKNVDLVRGIIYVRESLIYNLNKEWVISTPKTKSSIRDINIPLPLYKALQWQIERNRLNGIDITPDTHVLVKDNGRFITESNMKYMARIINQELGIKFGFHKLRHTYATILIERGANISDVSALLGHSNTSITLNTYVNNTDNMRKNTINVLNTLYE